MLLLLSLTQDSSDSTLLRPCILSALKILPSYRPVNLLLTMRVTHFHNVQKNYSTEEMLQAPPTAGQSLCSPS